MKRIFIAGMILLFIHAAARPAAEAATCLSCHPMPLWSGSRHAQVFGGGASDHACLLCHTHHPMPIPEGTPAFAYLRNAEVGGVLAVHNLCVQCHVSKIHRPRIPAPDTYSQFQKVDLGGSAMPLIFQGHRPFTGEHPEESILLGSKPDELPHIECTDCHNPHACNEREPLRGAKGIDMDGKPVGYGTANPRTPRDYEVCFRCHADSYQAITPYPDPPYRFRPPSYTNKRAEFNPGAGAIASFHPVALPGRNRSAALEEQLSIATGGKLTTRSTIRCVDCHNNDAFARVRGLITPAMGTYLEPEGPHGSLNKRILRAPYAMEVGTERHSPFTSYDPRNFMLCYDCHDEKAFDGGRDNKETNFYSGSFGNLHYLHLTGEGGKLPAFETCMECHYNVHGNVNADPATLTTSGGDNDTRLIEFYPGVGGSGGNPYPKWLEDPKEKSCAMVCHAHLMNYSYGGPRQ